MTVQPLLPSINTPMPPTDAGKPLVFGVVGRGITRNNALLGAFLQAYAQKPVTVKRVFPLLPTHMQTADVGAMLGWGRKKSHRRASRFAAQHDLPILTLEDGFLRGLGSGTAQRYGCSVVIDPVGIYFDAHAPSYLEQLIATSDLTAAQRLRAQTLRQRIVEAHLSKYNPTAATGTLGELAIDTHFCNVLLIDQVAGDQSVAGAGANAQTFADMLRAARKLYPNAKLWVKAHPAGKAGYLTALPLSPDVSVIQQAVNPLELLANMDAVCTVSSQMGFEALLLGKRVHCFGVAWYAGWGLTDDSYFAHHVMQPLYTATTARRAQRVAKPKTLDDLFHAAYLRYSYYANPATGQACDIEQVIDWLMTNRTWRERLPYEATVYAFSRWKYSFVRAFLASAGGQLQFIAKPKSVTDLPIIAKPFAELAQLKQQLNSRWAQNRLHTAKDIIVWGIAKRREIQRQRPNAQIWCMEDGFVRSTGLGASLIAPLSVVLDRRGIYYDATTTSDLEHKLVCQTDLTPTQSMRTATLIDTLLAQQVSKYNVGDKRVLTTHAAPHQRILLVVGQVEDDMSVQCCASDIRTNRALLEQVRAAHPNAYILYKPHPDVQAGLRTGQIDAPTLARLADQVVTDIAMPACLAAVDAVHTISSLTGFEALLRGLSVTCYGVPFYAGFGLTDDRATGAAAQRAYARRARCQPLSLQQLGYVTLITYPLYRVPNGFGLAQIEDVIAHLYQAKDNSQPPSDLNGLTQQLMQRLDRRIKQPLAKAFMQLRQRL